MPNFSKKDVVNWTAVMLDPSDPDIIKIKSGWRTYGKMLITGIAEALFNLMNTGQKVKTQKSQGKVFSLLTSDEKQYWYDYACRIPMKLSRLGLFIRPWTDFCRTCIITEEEIELMAEYDHIHDKGNTGKDDHIPFEKLPEQRKNYLRQLNYAIPGQIKLAGFEIVRREEDPDMDPVLIRKIAKAIHTRYLDELRKRDAGPEDVEYPEDFDDLPNEIKYSNRDNAYHIPTKLLSIGFRMRPVQKGFKPLTMHLDHDQIETMARVEHLRWSWDKRLNGWIYGRTKDNNAKTHPGLVPYDDLPESEKEKDRELVRLIPAILQDIEYVAYPVSPDRIRNLSYALRPQSSIHKLLSEIHKLTAGMAENSREAGITSINEKISHTINEVRESYNYAYHMQKTILPDDLFIRECFTDSFVLFMPKDIVSGDFYFFSKKKNTRIFAAADCTGHGIPGAFLSVIGYGITDEAVNEKNLAEPSDILRHIYSKVHRFLRWDEDKTGLSDDMDIVLCKYDATTGQLTWSGVSNPLYIISGDQLTEYRPAVMPEAVSSLKDCCFSSEVINTRKGDLVYLFSDGFRDQFGGGIHKKYGSSRLKSFLLSIREHTMTEQRDLLYEEIERWRSGNSDEDQTDDILMIGLRL